MTEFSLKELRARKGWTQEVTARKLGVSTTTYSAWENDFGKVKLRAAVSVAKLFGVKLSEIKL